LTTSISNNKLTRGLYHISASRIPRVDIVFIVFQQQGNIPAEAFVR